MPFRTIACYGRLEEAFLARARLEGDGIASFIPDELTASNDWGRILAMGGIRLQVAEEDWAQAAAVLGLPPRG
jgi:hypothetical protein